MGLGLRTGQHDIALVAFMTTEAGRCERQEGLVEPHATLGPGDEIRQGTACPSNWQGKST